MTPVNQTNYGKGQGNCLTACVASVLDVPISSLPEFCVDGEWFDRLYSFCQENGFSLIYWRHTESAPILCLDAYVILLLELAGEEDLHAVVGKTVGVDRVPVTDAEIENAAALSEFTGYKAGDVKWAWRTEIAHDPNALGIPPIKGPVGYLVIGKP